MGYMIQQSLQNALARAAVPRQVVTLVTQTLCDANDPNLRQPSKPIGHALDAVRVARLQTRGVPVREELPGRWRRLAPSPPPVAVVERDRIRDLLAPGPILVACGGRSEEHTSELQSRSDLVCRLLLEKKKSMSRSPANQRPLASGAVANDACDHRCSRVPSPACPAYFPRTPSYRAPRPFAGRSYPLVV